MINFEARYSVVGTSALKAHASVSQDHATIIEFPAPEITRGAHARHAGCNVFDSALATEIRTGSARGKAFDRIAPWQSVSAGIALAVVAFATIFFGI